MNLPPRIKNFNKRWNIDYDENRKFSEFKNRSLSTIDSIIGTLFLSDSDLEQRFLKLIGRHFPVAEIDTRPTASLSQVMGGIRRFEDLPVYKILLKEQDFKQFMRLLQSLFWLDLNSDVKDGLYRGLKEDIKLSMLPVQIKRTTQNDVILYPKGAKLLDEKVVNNVLDWLMQYPKVCKNFKSALGKYQNKIDERNLIDDLRLAFELLLKKILKNKKPLEKQRASLGQYLEGEKVPKVIRNMFTTLVNYYSDYQNQYAKHNDKVDESEIEFIIYLTGTFIRHLMVLERCRNNSKEKIMHPQVNSA